MTLSVIELPSIRKQHKLNIPLVYTPAVPKPAFEPLINPDWFQLTPVAKLVEHTLKTAYKQKYIHATAMTSKLQIKEKLLNVQ